jgi:hypothetical protein
MSNTDTMKNKFEAEGQTKRVTPPRHGDRQMVTVRLPRPVYEALVAATRKTGRSLTGEVEARVGSSIEREEEQARRNEEMSGLMANNTMLAGKINALNAQILELHEFMRKLAAENNQLKGDLVQNIVDQWRQERKTS